MLGALIGAGTSLLGGLFGSKKQKTTTESVVDYEAMVRRATKAGFNPLTALRNGGSAGFSSTTTTSHPGLSSIGQGIANAGSIIGGALEQKFDPVQQKRDEVEKKLLDYQLAAAQNSSVTPRMGEIPMRTTGSTIQRQTVPPMATQAGLKNGSAIPNMKLEAGDAPTVSSVGLEDRWNLTSDPKTADAAAWEQRYAEPGEWVGGIYTMGADAIYNAKEALKRAGVKNVDQAAAAGPAALANEVGRSFREYLAAPPTTDSWLDQSARWLDDALGTGKNAGRYSAPALKKGPRIGSGSTW